MNIIFTVCLALLAGNAVASNLFTPVLRSHPRPPTGPVRDDDEAVLGYFVQKLDHSNPDDTNVWAQKYYVNKKYFDATSNNVVFLELGGEGAIDKNSSLYGTFVDMGKKYNALMFQLEHRFYGESKPFSDSSTEHLSYLSSEQGLADAANFIKSMNEQYALAADVKWIVFGGSYSGALAAWMRLKYPDLVQGSVASSAPVLAKLNFGEYLEVTFDDMADASETCLENLKAAVRQAENILKDPNSDKSVSTILNICDPIEGLDSDNLNVKYFISTLAQIFSRTAQNAGIEKPTPAAVCDILDDETKGEEIYRLAEAVKYQHGDGCLFNNYAKAMESFQYIYYDKFDDRAWMYQTCAEFGWFQTTDWTQVFGPGVTIDYFTDMCAEVFGPSFNKTFTAQQIEKTNAKYGGLSLDVSNVVFVHGSLDPWHRMGVRRPVNPDSSAIFIKGTAHCADNYDIYPELPELTEAKKEIDRLVGVWLGVN